jgi:hypothetical protein
MERKSATSLCYFLYLKTKRLGLGNVEKQENGLREDHNLVPRAFPFLSLGSREKALAPGGHMTFNTHRLLHLLFGVLRIFGTLMEWNRRESHDCSELF